MKSRFEAWKRTLWVWSLPLAFCVLNLVVFTFYHTFYAGEVERLEALVERGHDEIEALEAETAKVEDFLARVEQQQSNVRDTALAKSDYERVSSQPASVGAPRSTMNVGRRGIGRWFESDLAEKIRAPFEPRFGAGSGERRKGAESNRRPK